MTQPDPVQLSPFRVKLGAILAAVERIRTSPEAYGNQEILQDLDTIQKATERLKELVIQFSAGAPPGLDASRIRHDLRTPLNHIIGYGEILFQEAEEVAATAILPDLSRIVRGGKEVLADIDELVRELVSPGGASRAATPIGITRSRYPVPVARTEAAVRGRILVVDDNAANVDLLTRRLTRAGHQVETATDGDAAVRWLEEQAFDVVLLDIVMPGRDGIAVLKHIKSDSHLQHVPVIMISGLDDMPKIVQCIQLGAEDYLSKPFDPVLLNARIGACLEKKQLRDRELHYLEQIELERRRAQELLRVILPDRIVQELQQTDTVKPRRYEGVGVLFCDIVGFTAYSERVEPEQVLANLQKLVEAYEGLMGLYKLQKIKTIGDSFMAASGLLERVDNPVLQCLRCGRDMIALAEELNTGWGVRVGISYGPVVAGVLGRQQYQFDLWGDTVNTASRVESHGVENGICVSGDAWVMVRNVPGVAATSLGHVHMKGKGAVPLVRIDAVDHEDVGIG